ARVLSGTAHGTLTVNADGGFTYTPDAGYVGADSFTFAAFDGALVGGSATVTIDVVADDPPPALPYATHSGAPLLVAAPDGVLAPFAAPGGAALAANLESGPAHGTLLLEADGSFRYLPAAGFRGRDQFTYRVHNGVNDLAVGTAVIDVLDTD